MEGESERGAGIPQPWSPGRATIHCTSCSTRAVTICTLEPLESLGGGCREGGGEGGAGKEGGCREGGRGGGEVE